MTKTARVDSTLKWGFRMIGLVVLGLIGLTLVLLVVAFVAGLVSG